MTAVRHFLLALQFFTRIPVTGRLAAWVGFSPAMLRAAAAHFPGVGWVVGGVGAAVTVAALALWPPLVAVALGTVATVLVTGAFHEDGLADAADGLGGSADAARALEIMRDSRIGAFGAISLVLVLGTKLALLATLAGQGAGAVAAALLAAHVLSRLAPLAVMRALPYVGGDGGKAKPMADAVSVAGLLGGLAWSAPAVGLLFMGRGATVSIAACAVLASATAIFGLFLRRRIGGFTGDGLGAVQQLGELSVYLVLAARLPGTPA